MRIRFKQWAVDYLKEHPEIVIDKIDFNDPFFKDKIYNYNFLPVILQIHLVR